MLDLQGCASGRCRGPLEGNPLRSLGTYLQGTKNPSSSSMSFCFLDGEIIDFVPSFTSATMCCLVTNPNNEST